MNPLFWHSDFWPNEYLFWDATFWPPEEIGAGGGGGIIPNDFRIYMRIHGGS